MTNSFPIQSVYGNKRDLVAGLIALKIAVFRIYDALQSGFVIQHHAACGGKTRVIVAGI